jgi:hypothetical protein
VSAVTTPTRAARSAVIDSVHALDGWITGQGWHGYDPHDIRGTRPFMVLLQPIHSIPLKVARRLLLTPLTAWERAYPRAARRLFGIEPTINAKGMGLFAKAYLQLYSTLGDDSYRQKALACLEWLEANRSPGYDEPCWGYPFRWQSGVDTPPQTPASVVTSAIGDAFWSAYQILGEARYLEVCQGVCRAFLKYLKRDELPDGSICFSYTPIDDFHVHNANLLVAEFLTRIGNEAEQADWRSLGERAGQYALNEQNADGSLYYWGRIQNHHCPGCIDHYHSGFEIRCLHAIARNTGRADFRTAAQRYYEFYLRNLVLVTPDVIMPKMTPRSVYPVNIHSCAEAILVAATLYDEFPQARELLEPLTQWAIANMQTESGAFAYMRRRRLGREVIHDFPFHRWGQGWMLLALSQYLMVKQS